jgi:hypothetical protein
MPRHERHSAAAVSESLMSCARRIILASLSLAMVAGCATGTTEEFDHRIATCVGRPEAAVVAGLGVPSRTYEGNGGRLLQYEW